MEEIITDAKTDWRRFEPLTENEAEKSRLERLLTYRKRPFQAEPGSHTVWSSRLVWIRERRFWYLTTQ